MTVTTCHPVLPTESRVALTLRLLGGLTTDEIARAYLVPEATVGKRITRAKRILAEQKVPIELPPPAEAAQRLAPVLEVIYLIFNEGYAATAGDDGMRPALCTEALRLGRVLAGLAVAIGHAHDPGRALAIVDALVLPSYPLLPAVRADLLARLGRSAEARDEFRRAAAMTRNARERTIFESRAAELD